MAIEVKDHSPAVECSYSGHVSRDRVGSHATPYLAACVNRNSMEVHGVAGSNGTRPSVVLRVREHTCRMNQIVRCVMSCQQTEELIEHLIAALHTAREGRTK